MAVPDTIYKGISLVAEITCHDYPSTEWSADFSLSKEGEDIILISFLPAGPNGSFVVTQGPEWTDALAVGIWRWTLQAYKPDTDPVFLAAFGDLTVAELYAGSTEITALKARIDAAEAELAERISGKPSSYSIKDRSLSRMTTQELMQGLHWWRRRLKDLQRQEARKCGATNSRITYGRFSR